MSAARENWQRMGLRRTRRNKSLKKFFYLPQRLIQLARVLAAAAGVVPFAADNWRDGFEVSAVRAR
jgi:hypothetical protein